MTADLVDGGARSADAPPAHGEAPLTVALAGVLADVLGVPRVDPAADFFADLGADSLLMTRFCARVRKRDDLPSITIKDVYQHPTLAGLVSALEQARSTPLERALAGELAGVLDVAAVPPDADFFADLGADSLLMTRFCARVRKRDDLPSIAIRDVYRHPTIRSLAAAVATAPVEAAAVRTAPAAAPVETPAVPAPAPAPAGPGARTARAGTGAYLLCGALQFLAFLAYVAGIAVVATHGHEWISGATGAVDVYLRAVVFGSGLFLGMSLLPIAVKWLLIGRWRPGRIRIWSLGYLRFWLVKTLVRANPLAFLVNGSPLYALYLRALGARVGPGVAVFGHVVPVCTDLLTIGAGTVIRKDSLLAGYRAVDGWIEIGPVTIGRDVLVGEATVIDIDTVLGDGAQLGHASSLHAGQSVPAGEHWHGSPAEPTAVDYRDLPAARCGRLRRFSYGASQLASTALLYLPLTLAGVDILLAEDPALAGVLTAPELDLASPEFYLDALVVSAVLFGGLVVGGLLLVAALPRLLALGLRPGQVYPLYGVRYSLHRTVNRLTSVKFFPYLFGDSSYIVGYLRWLGWDVSRREQTGSAFGTQVGHETPYLVTVGAGTMVADGLSVMNADFTSTSFRLSPVTIGAHNFLGNRIHYPAQGRTGDDCLLATKAMVPIDGPVREGVGLLGSPSFEIPRSVLRDSRFDSLREPAEFRRRLRAKNRYNRRTIALALLVRWVHVFGLVLLALACAHAYERFGALAVAVEILLATLFTAVYFVLVERTVTRFRRLSPRFCSIYEPYFWWHERYWKLVIPEFDKAFAGTPFKNVVSRALGTGLGRRVFDDGCFLPERTLVTIGDDATLNAGTVIQCHSQEDGGFKSDHTRLGDRVTLGVGAFVHYGVAIGDDAALAPDTFLMKGEEVPAGARWGGNPAQPMEPGARPAPAAPSAPAPVPGTDRTPQLAVSR